MPEPIANETLPRALAQRVGAECLPRPCPARPGFTLQKHPWVVHGQDPAPPKQTPRATANLQQQMVLEDALHGFQQEALQGQRVVELGLALLQPQGCRRGQ